MPTSDPFMFPIATSLGSSSLSAPAHPYTFPCVSSQHVLSSCLVLDKQMIPNLVVWREMQKSTVLACKLTFQGFLHSVWNGPFYWANTFIQNIFLPLPWFFCKRSKESKLKATNITKGSTCFDLPTLFVQSYFKLKWLHFHEVYVKLPPSMGTGWVLRMLRWKS